MKERSVQPFVRHLQAFWGAGQAQPELAQPSQNNPPCRTRQQRGFGFPRGAAPSVFGHSRQKGSSPQPHIFPVLSRARGSSSVGLGSRGHLGRSCHCQPRSIAFCGRDERETLSDQPWAASEFVWYSIPLQRDILFFFPPIGIRFKDNTELIIKPFGSSSEDLYSFSRRKEHSLV